MLLLLPTLVVCPMQCMILDRYKITCVYACVRVFLLEINTTDCLTNNHGFVSVVS